MVKIYKIIFAVLIGVFMLAGASFYVLANSENVPRVDQPNNIVDTSTAAEINNLPVVQNTGTSTAPAGVNINSQIGQNSTSESQPQNNFGTTTAVKLIDISLSEQRLTYFNTDGTQAGSFLISSGIKTMPSPTGTFYVQKKIPVKLYKGPSYYLPNTKWNLMFLPGYYIHGAYWHNNFGHPMSHGCINVSYANMEGFYNWAEVGTKIVIHN